jgi:hypothetical protein
MDKILEHYERYSYAEKALISVESESEVRIMVGFNFVCPMCTVQCFMVFSMYEQVCCLHMSYICLKHYNPPRKQMHDSLTSIFYVIYIKLHHLYIITKDTLTLLEWKRKLLLLSATGLRPLAPDVCTPH